MRAVTFQASAFSDFTEWSRADPKIFERVTKLIAECARHPFEGTGKPEPLRHQYKGCWSRRITDEHRLVYRVTEEAIIVLGCRYHYK